MKFCVLLRSALALRALSPPLALMTAQETALSGAFRNAHQARSLPAAERGHTLCHLCCCRAPRFHYYVIFLAGIHRLASCAALEDL